MKHLSSLLAVLMVLGLASGCGLDSQQLVSPGPTAGFSVAQSLDESSSLIGPGGGALSAGGVTLSVPEKALLQFTTVTLSVTESNGKYEVSVGPAAVGLRRSATLIVPCGSGSCGMRWLNPASRLWEELSVSTSPGHVLGKIIDFSDFDTSATD